MTDFDIDEFNDMLAQAVRLFAACGGNVPRKLHEELMQKPAPKAYPLTDEQLHLYTTEDDLHKHFDALNLDNWVDVNLEGERVLSVCAEVDIGDSCLVADVMAAVAAEAQHTAFRAVARLFGIDCEALEWVASTYEETPETPPIDFAEFRKQLDEASAELAVIHARRASIPL